MQSFQRYMYSVSRTASGLESRHSPAKELNCHGFVFSNDNFEFNGLTRREYMRIYNLNKF